MAGELIPQFTKEDYLQSTAPYEWLYKFHEDKLKMKQLMTLMSETAKATCGIRNFIGLFREYENLMNAQSGEIDGNVTEFEGQEIELMTGRWYADDMGVVSTDKFGFEIVACNHPIMPIQRLVNIDTGEEKLKLAYRKSKQWRSIIIGKKTLASAQAILQLAEVGIAVNSENSKYLVRYLTDIENLNYDRINEVTSVSRLGWIEDYGFSPYVDNLVFDGDRSYKHFFEAVTQKGSFMRWIEQVKEIRSRGNIITNLMLAASFSSVLVSICDALPFIIHLWGGSGAGKSVALMLGASVWANPKIGAYIHTFNGTAVAQELSASFVNSLPLMLDELQILKDRKDFDNMIYFLCEGVGRSRGQKTGGLQKIGTWSNCILTNGEMPISENASGGGAINRVVEIDCKDEKLFSDPRGTVEFLKKNYGHAGKYFVEKLENKENVKYAKAIQKQLYEELSAGKTTEKQAMAASIILTADRLIEEWIFGDEQLLSIEDIIPFLSTKSEVSVNDRALDFLYDFISVNQNKFMTKHTLAEDMGEIWGVIDDKNTYIIKSQFDKILSSNGYNPKAFLSWAKRKGIIECSGNKHTKPKRIGSNVSRCVCLKNLDNIEFLEIDNDKDLPWSVTPVTPVTPKNIYNI